MVIGVGGAFFPVWYSAALLPIFLIWYNVQSKALVPTYPVSHSKLTIKQANKGAAAGFGKPVLWALLGGSALCVAAALWMSLSGQTSDQRATGFLGVLLFGACAVKVVYMLKTKQ